MTWGQPRPTGWSGGGPRGGDQPRFQTPGGAWRERAALDRRCWQRCNGEETRGTAACPTRRDMAAHQRFSKGVARGDLRRERIIKGWPEDGAPEGALYGSKDHWLGQICDTREAVAFLMQARSTLAASSGPATTSAPVLGKAGAGHHRARGGPYFGIGARSRVIWPAKAL